MYAASDSKDGQSFPKLHLATFKMPAPGTLRRAHHDQIQPYLKKLRSNLMTIGGLSQVRFGEVRFGEGETSPASNPAGRCGSKTMP